MNIEQKTSLQEISEEDCTKVHGGIGFFDSDELTTLALDPRLFTDPKDPNPLGN